MAEAGERSIEHFIINGIANLPGFTDVQWWRIDNMAKEKVGIDFLRKPDVLVLTDPSLPDNGRALAEAVCKALNGLEAAHGQR